MQELLHLPHDRQDKSCPCHLSDEPVRFNDVIFLVYPLWWNTLPMAVEGFLKQYDLTGKTLIPIVTHGGSGIGESLKALHKATQAKFPESYLWISTAAIFRPQGRKSRTTSMTSASYLYPSAEQDISKWGAA